MLRPVPQALKLPDAAIITAAHFLCQFRTSKGHADVPDDRLVAACLFLACKVRFHSGSSEINLICLRPCFTSSCAAPILAL